MTQTARRCRPVSYVYGLNWELDCQRPDSERTQKATDRFTDPTGLLPKSAANNLTTLEIRSGEKPSGKRGGWRARGRQRAKANREPRGLGMNLSNDRGDLRRGA